MRFGVVLLDFKVPLAISIFMCYIYPETAFFKHGILKALPAMKNGGAAERLHRRFEPEKSSTA